MLLKVIKFYLKIILIMRRKNRCKSMFGEQLKIPFDSMKTIRTLLVQNFVGTKNCKYFVYYVDGHRDEITRKQFLILKPFFKVSETLQNTQEIFETLFSECKKTIAFNVYSKSFIL